MKILYAEDDELVQELVTETLSGHEVTVAADGKEALNLFIEAASEIPARKFDLVLTDRNMPQLSGDALAKAISEIDPTIPIIMITADAAEIGHQLNTPWPEGLDFILAKTSCLKYPEILEKFMGAIEKALKRNPC